MKIVLYLHKNYIMETSPRVKILMNKLRSDRQNSFWYFGSVIATIQFRGSRLSIKSKGDISIQFEKNGDVFKNIRAVEEALNLHFTDRQINNLNTSNHFIITDENEGCDIDVANTYDKAIELALQLSVELV